ncbi:Hypothetical predicted protein [Paramuricea clavata]|uniref:Uncharacterized protein n=1 Tax=Paramuricea clavata TaxID=317549 RepID=A0A7D9F1T7_PARCT|nr:Hypothetical predicted protein [Paramuricea clavata]
MFKPYISGNTNCAHAEEMARKSEVMTMPVVMKDEKEYADIVEVLDQLEKWTHEIYTAAGMCSSDPESSDDTTNPTVGTTSRPDQPGSHVPPAASESATQAAHRIAWCN